MGYESESNTNGVQIQEIREGQKRAIDNAKADIKRMSESYDVKQKALIPDIETKKMRGYLKDQLPPDAVLDAYGAFVEEHITENSPKWIKDAYDSVDKDMQKVQAELDNYIQEESGYDDSNSEVFLDRGAAPNDESKKDAEKDKYEREQLPLAIAAINNLVRKTSVVKEQLDNESYVAARKQLNKSSLSTHYALDEAERAVRILRSMIARSAYDPIHDYDITEQELIDSEKEYLSTDPGIYHRKYNKQDSNDLSLYLEEVKSFISDEEKVNKDNFTAGEKRSFVKKYDDKDVTVEYEFRNFNYWSEPTDVIKKPSLGLGDGFEIDKDETKDHLEGLAELLLDAEVISKETGRDVVEVVRELCPDENTQKKTLSVGEWEKDDDSDYHQSVMDRGDY